MVLSKEKKILFVIGSMEIGGAEKQLFTLIEQIQKRSMDCHIFALQVKGPIFEKYQEIGIPIFSGNMKKGDISRAPWKLLFAEMRLLSCIIKIKPDVIHGYLPLVTFLTAVSGWICKVPLIITSRRALSTHQDRYPFLKYLDRIANYLSSKVTVNSQAVLQDTVKRDYMRQEKLVLIYNGIDPEPYCKESVDARKNIRQSLRIGKDTKIVITIANYIPYKGLMDLLLAAAQVKKETPSAFFLLVGEDRGIQKELESRAKELEIDSIIKFTGQRTDIPELLAASDLSVLPSHEEGFSNVILESMASGLPVVATKVGGNLEAVNDGFTGFLVSPHRPAELAENILTLLNDPKKTARFGQESQNRVIHHFSLEKMVQSHLNLYQGTRTK